MKMKWMWTGLLLSFAPLAVFAQQSEDPKSVPPDAKEDEAKKPEKAPLDVSKMPFTPAAISKVVEHDVDKVQACYEETLAVNQKPVKGKLQTSFVITPEGLVKQAKVEKKGTTLPGKKLHECVVTVLSGLTFPKPADNRDHPVRYPFNLKPVR